MFGDLYLPLTPDLYPSLHLLTNTGTASHCRYQTLACLCLMPKDTLGALGCRMQKVIARFCDCLFNLQNELFCLAMLTGCRIGSWQIWHLIQEWIEVLIKKASYQHVCHRVRGTEQSSQDQLVWRTSMISFAYESCALRTGMMYKLCRLPRVLDCFYVWVLKIH